jgi:hypothetical protein
MILSFHLTMPNKGSWNQKWTSENNLYIKFRNLSKKEAENILQNKDHRDFYYGWPDGWGANVRVEKTSSVEKQKLEKKSAGFCNYDWMIDSILENGKIISPDKKTLELK